MFIHKKVPSVSERHLFVYFTWKLLSHISTTLR